MGFVPATKGPSVSAAADLRPGDQVWFHHGGYVHHVAEVVAIISNLEFDRALWGESDFPASGFVFTVTEPQEAHIAKADINKLLGYQPDFRWQGNRLLTEEKSQLLASQIWLTARQKKLPAE